MVTDQELIVVLGEALCKTSPYVDTDPFDRYARAPGRREAVDAYLAWRKNRA